MAIEPITFEWPAGTPRHEGRRAAVIGSPIAHSLSPALHTAAYEALGLRGWFYGRAEVREDQLADALDSLTGEWAGLSVTMPLKKRILDHLDVVEPLAEVVGAVNTVLLQPAGDRNLLVGANTDVHGIVAAVREAGPLGWEPESAVILGAGATAASALAALAELGITAVILLARSPARAQPTLLAAQRMGVSPRLVTWSDDAAALPAVSYADVVVSTLPAHGADGLASAVRARGGEEAGDRVRVLLDVSYDPWPSALTEAWREVGGRVAPGWSMLLHQAAEQVRLMTGRTPPVETMRRAIEAALGRS